MNKGLPLRCKERLEFFVCIENFQRERMFWGVKNGKNIRSPPLSRVCVCHASPQCVIGSLSSVYFHMIHKQDILKGITAMNNFNLDSDKSQSPKNLKRCDSERLLDSIFRFYRTIQCVLFTSLCQTHGEIRWLPCIVTPNN